ncbi:alpha/beta fold hydrolase [Pararhizobium haloflavum]|uniref:alpha/beta fold hydrolase n=1 Tax=Pararhizobium haloflavum TaxID=2037914 RepID=UPI000C19AA59|nr:alpha/beta hydrolase [Pararhizobium haloflavum]
MAYVATKDGTHLYAKDWGSGPAMVLIHGWPLNADMWDYQALPLAEAGFRVISYDRRGFGRSNQPWTGYDYDTFASDLQDVLAAFDVNDATLVGFSMGGGEVARYIGRYGRERVAKAALISSVVPYMLKTPDNEAGVPQDVFDAIKTGLRKDRAAFLKDFNRDFYGVSDKPGAVSDAVLDWTGQVAMMASAKATIDCVDAFGRTDFRDDVKAFDLPTLIVHGTNDKTVPIDTAGRAAAKRIPSATLKEYDGAPHGLFMTHKDRLTEDLIAFQRG